MRLASADLNAALSLKCHSGQFVKRYTPLVARAPAFPVDAGWGYNGRVGRRGGIRASSLYDLIDGTVYSLIRYGEEFVDAIPIIVNLAGGFPKALELQIGEAKYAGA